VLAADLDGGRYVTLLLVCLDPESRSLIYASAGHVSGYLLDEEGELESTLESTGLPLGLFADSEYETRECGCLDRGKVLVLVTDGIAETRSPEGTEFGVARTLDTLRRHRQQDSSRIMEALHQATSTFRGRRVQDDDLTYVVCQAE
jgi:serine phosphatase RsbU (regulator of sigma subunit)